MFYQLYVLHGLIEEKVLSLVYFLLPEKTQKLYKNALQAINNFDDNLAPDEVIVDFERAFINSFTYVFQGVKVKYCYFHCGQCVYRNVVRNAL